MILPLISPSQLGVFLSKKLNVAQYVEPDTLKLISLESPPTVQISNLDQTMEL